MSAIMPLPRRRPTALVVLAILNLIFGGFGLLFGGLGLAMNESGAAEWFAQFQKNQPNQIKGLSYGEIMTQMAERIPSVVIVQRVAGVAGALTSLFLVLSGIGLLKLRPWGRYFGFAYVAVQLPVHIANSIFSLVWVTPVMRDIMNEALARMPAGFMHDWMQFWLGVSGLFSIVTIFLSLLYPILVLVVLLLPSVKQAVKQQPTPTAVG